MCFLVRNPSLKLARDVNSTTFLTLCFQIKKRAMEKTRNKYKRENSYLELYNDDFYNGISLKSGTFSSHCKGGVNLNESHRPHTGHFAIKVKPCAQRIKHHSPAFNTVLTYAIVACNLSLTRIQGEKMSSHNPHSGTILLVDGNGVFTCNVSVFFNCQMLSVLSECLPLTFTVT